MATEYDKQYELSKIQYYKEYNRIRAEFRLEVLEGCNLYLKEEEIRLGKKYRKYAAVKEFVKIRESR